MILLNLLAVKFWSLENFCKVLLPQTHGLSWFFFHLYLGVSSVSPQPVLTVCPLHLLEGRAASHHEEIWCWLMRGVPPGMIPAGVSGRSYCVTGFLIPGFRWRGEENGGFSKVPDCSLIVALNFVGFFLVVIPSSIASERIIKYPFVFLNLFLGLD